MEYTVVGAAPAWVWWRRGDGGAAMAEEPSDRASEDGVGGAEIEI